ncbi:BTB/POZ domain-containing protein [Pyrus ussuriensis x Pyrus communis]|uniref:BTB/POZ domain-containing protein n=1 Tax=Pyrus ussuriensis x Pyrus communis TaxID=2448454 RepID=A0A5N5FGK5_9ROSA|nr:BTB/POZ domain-containing protein [Pyrus ussuriensis x Pyrus communis]
MGILPPTRRLRARSLAISPSKTNTSQKINWDSPETGSGFRLSSTPESIRPSSSCRAWWFDDVALLSPNIIEKLLQILGAYGPENNSLILTAKLQKSSLIDSLSLSLFTAGA